MTVTETAKDDDQIEITCPNVIHPGDYFSCVIDMPTGSGLTAEVVMTDDLDAAITDTSTVMNVPGKDITSFAGMEVARLDKCPRAPRVKILVQRKKKLYHAAD